MPNAPVGTYAIVPLGVGCGLEQRTAFRRHFEEQLRLYGPQILVSLVERTGAEADVGDAYETQVLLFRNSNLRYIAFDFHERCKGNRYENVLFLIRDGTAPHRTV